MKRVVITPAALPVAALAELKEWLGISTPHDDAALTALLRTALELCEDFTGSAPLLQTCEAVLPVRRDWQGLGCSPVQAITAVLGIPAEGARFPLPVEDYAIDLTAAGDGQVRIGNPGAAGRIAVRFEAGIAADWASLPDALRHGVIRLAVHLYRSRESGTAEALPPAAIGALWRPWRRMRVA